MLIDNFMVTCVLMERKRVSDGAGGFITTWEDGAEFDAAIIRDATMQARIAEKEGVSSVYTVTTQRGTVLDFHDVFKRVSDNATFRVTSTGGEKQSPTVGTLDIAQVTAERWELTT